MQELITEIAIYLGLSAVLGFLLGWLVWGLGHRRRIAAARAEGAAEVRTSVDGDSSLRIQVEAITRERDRLENRVEVLSARVAALLEGVDDTHELEVLEEKLGTVHVRVDEDPGDRMEAAAAAFPRAGTEPPADETIFGDPEQADVPETGEQTDRGDPTPALEDEEPANAAKTGDVAAGDPTMVDTEAVDVAAGDVAAVDVEKSDVALDDRPDETIAADEPAGDAAAAVISAASEPAADGSAAEGPAAGNSVADDPASDEPAADEPAADEPAADEPASGQRDGKEPALADIAAAASGTDVAGAGARAGEDPGGISAAASDSAVPPGRRLFEATAALRSGLGEPGTVPDTTPGPERDAGPIIDDDGDALAPEQEAAPSVLLAEPPERPDDLTRISGIGKSTSKALNGRGVWLYSQLAEMSPAETAWLRGELGNQMGRSLEKWADQARKLMND